MNYKKTTIKTYDQIAVDFDKDALKRFENIKFNAELFTSFLSGDKVLDVGCGSGVHMLYFKEKGLNVTGIDLSSKMIELCLAKGLTVQRMDLERLEFEPESFDGVWAYTSLIHVPINSFPGVLESIQGLLKPNGVLGLSMKRGAGECYKFSERYVKKYGFLKRFYALQPERAIRGVLEDYFMIDYFNISDDRYLNYICHKQ